MIFLNLNTWSSYKFSDFLNYTWVWKRYYKKGYLWTAFIYLQIKKKNYYNGKIHNRFRG